MVSRSHKKTFKNPLLIQSKTFFWFWGMISLFCGLLRKPVSVFNYMHAHTRTYSSTVNLSFRLKSDWSCLGKFRIKVPFGGSSLTRWARSFEGQGSIPDVDLLEEIFAPGRQCAVSSAANVFRIHKTEPKYNFLPLIMHTSTTHG